MMRILRSDDHPGGFMRKNKVLPGSVIRIATVSALVAPAAVLAGGFSLNEQSASAMGVANAGTAANPENATTEIGRASCRERV